MRCLTAWGHENFGVKKQKRKRLEHNWSIHSYAGASRLMFRYCCVFIYVTGMDGKMLCSPYVLLQDRGCSTLFSLLLSFAVNLWVGLNDPCVLGICYPKLGVCTQHHTSGIAQVKCRSQIVTHMWEQKKASLFSFFFFFSPSSRWFLYFQDGG